MGIPASQNAFDHEQNLLITIFSEKVDTGNVSNDEVDHQLPLEV